MKLNSDKASLNIVLYQPAIILNVGNIARTCYAFNANLHLIKPYGFIFDKTKLKRSSTNHFDLINYYEYDNWNEFANQIKENDKIYLFTKKGNKSPNEINLKSNYETKTFFVFGNEQYGIDTRIMDCYKNNWIRIPINKDLICLNISNTVAIASYEFSKQNNYENLLKEWK